MGISTLWLRPRALLLAVGLACTAAVAQPLTGPSWPLGVRRVDVPDEPAEAALEVRISPGLSTALHFDSEFEDLELEGRERFSLVDAGRTTLRLLPSRQVLPGEQLRLRVRFKDGKGPASATFTLRVQPGQAEPLVEVYRRRRGVESYEQELREVRQEMLECQAHVERLRTRGAGSEGLRSLLASEVLGDKGVAVHVAAQTSTWKADGALPLHRIRTFRSNTRIAVDLTLVSTEGRGPQGVEGAALTTRTGEPVALLPLWQTRFLEDGEPRLRVVVEAEAQAAEDRGPFTLKLWGTGLPNFRVRDLTFP